MLRYRDLQNVCKFVLMLVLCYNFPLLLSEDYFALILPSIILNDCLLHNGANQLLQRETQIL